MNPALAAVAIVTVAGAVLAVSARDVRATVLGLLVVWLTAPLVADPWPGPLAILARIAACLLAVRLVAIPLRGETATTGSRIGWPAEALLAVAAATIGFGSHGLGSAGLGPAEAGAAGFALVVLAAAPLFTGRDALRLGVGAVLLLVAASLIRAGLDRAPSDAEHLVTSALTVALGGAVAVVVRAARTAGGLEQVHVGASDDRPDRGARRAPDAHPIGRRPAVDPESPGLPGEAREPREPRRPGNVRTRRDAS